jgi:GT2 family glycosyltransferase
VSASEATPQPLASWSAVVINWNGAADLPACLAALLAQAWPATEIVVVDNASADDSLAVLRAFGERPGLRVLANPTNLGFAGGANAGIATTTGDLVATFNPDVAVRPDWSARLRDAFAADARLGAAGGKLLFPDGATIQHAGGRIEQPSLVGENIGRGEPDRGQYDAPAEVDFLTGGALMLRRTALDAVGPFDERFYPAYFEDVDLCVRLRAAGWGVRYIPTATGRHREGAGADGAGAAYYRMVHAGRLRFAAKQLPLRELVGVFLPAEAARLAVDLQHAVGALAADKTGLSVFPAALLAPAPAVVPARAGVDPALGANATPKPTDPTAESADRAAARLDPRPLLDQLAEVGRRWLVEERPFTSSAPLIAPLVVWLRSRLIDAGPRWHVKQILAQQVEFNAAVYRALAGATAEAQAARLGAEASAALLVERLEALSAQQADLLARLSDLEQRLARLETGSSSETGGEGSEPGI